MKSANLNFLEPPGPLQACNGTALLFFAFTTENKVWSISEAGNNVTDIYTMYCQFLNRGQLVEYRLMFGLRNFKLKLAVNKRASHLTTSVTNLNVERVTGMMRDTHQFTLWKTVEELNMNQGTPQYILMAWCLLSTHTNNFPLITACDGISEFENCLLDCSETGEV